MTISILAFAVAVVIALKELIQCISGSIMKAVGRPFKLGDRIEFHNIRGDVIDHNVLTTTILELGPDQMTQQLTGRAIVLLVHVRTTHAPCRNLQKHSGNR
ncbi:mechanosensitive ion channel domain-containing protein [Blastopirellula retiformator]|uniref:mechanosensitive ion channel domain-containing protein n=1 Tax=Blastopirellula retiformator TaxID=2527970 RepID=UPI0011B479F9|nr:mechanosensitive ion channel domain-containing protein [Blastopirellula retiformator]